MSRNASQAEIKKTFRTQAKKHHPDKGGDAAAFKKINEAYEVLSDEKKREQYDQFGSATTGAGFSGFGGAGQGGGFSANSDFGGVEDIFSSFFGGARGARRTSQASRGSALAVEVELDFY